MDAEKVLNLYDWFWFQRHLFGKEPNLSFWPSSERNPDGENDVKAEALEKNEEVIPRTETISSSSCSVSPNSVLSNSEFRSLFSDSTTDSENSEPTPFKAAASHQKMRRKRKSLTQLEFEEVKGFRDLGFVFLEEDRNSSLASVIPGLHRLGLEEEEEEEEKEKKEVLDESKISRPYLSEAWEWEFYALDRRRKELINPLLKNWKLPSFSSEIDMKRNLRWWAHTVASTVR